MARAVIGGHGEAFKGGYSRAVTGQAEPPWIRSAARLRLVPVTAILCWISYLLLRNRPTRQARHARQGVAAPGCER